MKAAKKQDKKKKKQNCGSSQIWNPGDWVTLLLELESPGSQVQVTA